MIKKGRISVKKERNGGKNNKEREKINIKEEKKKEIWEKSKEENRVRKQSTTEECIKENQGNEKHTWTSKQRKKKKGES